MVDLITTTVRARNSTKVGPGETEHFLIETHKGIGWVGVLNLSPVNVHVRRRDI